MMLFEAELSFIVPPKANRYQVGKNGRKFLPQRVREAIDDAVLILSSFRDKTIESPCQLYVVYTFPDKRKRDIDNLNKSLQDCLEKAGIVKDDALFYRTISEKRFEKGVERTLIRIFPLNFSILLPEMKIDSVKRKVAGQLR